MKSIVSFSSTPSGATEDRRARHTMAGALRLWLLLLLRLLLRVAFMAASAAVAVAGGIICGGICGQAAAAFRI